MVDRKRRIAIDQKKQKDSYIINNMPRNLNFEGKYIQVYITRLQNLVKH